MSVCVSARRAHADASQTPPSAPLLHLSLMVQIPERVRRVIHGMPDEERLAHRVVQACPSLTVTVIVVPLAFAPGETQAACRTSDCVAHRWIRKSNWTEEVAVIVSVCVSFTRPCRCRPDLYGLRRGIFIDRDCTDFPERRRIVHRADSDRTSGQWYYSPPDRH